jgi:hypothetical protein
MNMAFLFFDAKKKLQWQFHFAYWMNFKTAAAAFSFCPRARTLGLLCCCCCCCCCSCYSRIRLVKWTEKVFVNRHACSIVMYGPKVLIRSQSIENKSYNFIARGLVTERIFSLVYTKELFLNSILPEKLELKTN